MNLAGLLPSGISPTSLPTTQQSDLTGKALLQNKLVSKWNLMVKLTDDFLLHKKSPPTARAQVLVSIYHELTTAQRSNFAHMLQYRKTTVVVGVVGVVDETDFLISVCLCCFMFDVCC